ILFLDTYDRLNYKNIFSLNPGICRAVYLPEIKTSGLTLRDISFLKKLIYDQMQDALVRYNANWITPVPGP
ncbi:MAG: 1-acyl-sn-glycerol-3-phosphate acyltransferase, partial [Ginsengibacter sp.]